jgi:hypothetical protein
MKIEQYVAGMQPPSKKFIKIGVLKSKHFFRLWIEDYLRGIVHNFQLQI